MSDVIPVYRVLWFHNRGNKKPKLEMWYANLESASWVFGTWYDLNDLVRVEVIQVHKNSIFFEVALQNSERYEFGKQCVQTT